ncbi:ATP-binding protein [Niabella ginsenosidivorans]|uniref:hypothetical protein n=1 Tax=Niabella ginsenosidivorans TaxID=1176587 RepID=UPI000AE45AEB|nr:hypothetical protein [Niabella ginsenosidivorans]
MKELAGRKEEQQLLNELLHSERPEFVAVFGRRRVGKTFLIRQVFNKQLVFHITGIANVNTSRQLSNFFTVFREVAPTMIKEVPVNWFKAFELLRSYLIKLSASKKK